VLPDGWEALPVSGKFLMFGGPRVGDSRVMIIVTQEQNSNMLEMYTAFYQDDFIAILTNYKQISEDFLNADDGSIYFKWVFEDDRLGIESYRTIYFYDAGDWKLLMMYQRLRSVGPEFDAAVDAAMKTVQYAR
jgi:hypothetical protein